MNRKTFLKCGFFAPAGLQTALGKDFSAAPKKYDVIVAGGGPAGFSAAIAAAECGAKTLLIEDSGELGGAGGSGCVNHWLGGRTTNAQKFTVGGIFKRIVLEAEKEKIAHIPTHCDQKYPPFGWVRGALFAGIPFDGVRMAELLDRKVLESGAEILFFTRVVGCKTEGGKITEITLHNKGGFFTASAGRYIDATGDADLAAAAGAPFKKGRDGDGKTAPATLEFHVSGVDGQKLSEYINKNDSKRFIAEIKNLEKRGIWKFPYTTFISVQLYDKDNFMINTSRLVGVDGTDGGSVSGAMVEGRRQAVELLRIMKSHFPGFENARISRIAPKLGVRETRRISADFTLKVSDLASEVSFDDTIGFSCYGWDLPDPDKPSHQPMHGKKMRKGHLVPLPFRIMVPRKISNLTCPGRCVSAERQALGAIRVMAPCMAMGEAAGVNAATGLCGEELRKKLRERGCIVDASQIL